MLDSDKSYLHYRLIEGDKYRPDLDDEHVEYHHQNLEVSEEEKKKIYAQVKNDFSSFAKFGEIIHDEKVEHCLMCSNEMKNDCVEVKCGHKFCSECLNMHLDNNIEDTCPECNISINRDRDIKVIIKKEKVANREIVSHIWTHSTKTKKFMNELLRVLETTNDKCIVFSQWVTFLQMIYFLFRYPC